MKGGHGEVFAQDFGGDGLPQTRLSSLAPGEAAAALKNERIVGVLCQNSNKFEKGKL